MPQRTGSHCHASLARSPRLFGTSMPARTLASLAHALSLATDLDGALIALSESLAELGLFAQPVLVRFDARRGMMRERLLVSGRSVDVAHLDTTLDHLPSRD